VAICGALVDLDMRRHLAAPAAPFKVRLERPCGAEALPPPPPFEGASLTQEEGDASMPLVLVPGIGRACFAEGDDPADAGAESDASPASRRSSRIQVTVARTSTFRDVARCESFRSRLAEEAAADRESGRRAGREWLEGQLAQAEKELAQSVAAQKEAAARDGTIEALERRQDDLRRKMEAARAAGDRAREKRATERAFENDVRLLDARRLERGTNQMQKLVETLRARIDAPGDDAPLPAIAPCVLAPTPRDAG
jgi:hypothetical protein